MTAWLTTTYFGPISWYQALNRADETVIEQWESFQKQTYRNRCVIATTQGTQILTVPVDRHSLAPCPLPHAPIKDVRISDHGNWRHLHWNALQSAYGESPFFEYYQDDIRPFFEQRWTFLLDFNETIRQKICELIDIQPKVRYSTEFRAEPPETATVLSGCAEGTASAISCPLPLAPCPYYQVYQQKHGFLPDLSILDLLFNMGPESIFYI